MNTRRLCQTLIFRRIPNSRLKPLLHDAAHRPTRFVGAASAANRNHDIVKSCLFRLSAMKTTAIAAISDVVSRLPGTAVSLARISHQDHGSRRRTKPACLTRWTSPHLIFESTKHFAQSAIHKVIPLLRKMLCGSRSRRDHLVPG